MKPEIETPKDDRLCVIFEMQTKLMERLGVPVSGLDEKQKVEWLLNYCRAISQEVAEATDSVPWKWWAKYQKYDEQNVRVEIIDLLHFVVGMAIITGMTADDFFGAFLKKNKVNHDRQDRGYTKKDENDSRGV